MNSVEQRLADLEQLVMMSGHDIIDSRLDDLQKSHMKHMMNTLGIDEREAKIRVLCMGTPPDHFKVIPKGGEYPRMLYHKNGKFAKVEDEDEHKAMEKEGWVDKPLPIHLKKLQLPAAARDEQIKRLKKELDDELAKKAEEQLPPA